MSVPQDAQLRWNNPDMEAVPWKVPSHWRDMRQHVFYGALYHWFVMFRNGDYRNFRPHRDLPVTKEFQLYLQRLLLMPYQAIERRLATWRIRNGGFPYHLALLQLEHDSSFQKHSPFTSMSEFLAFEVFEGFATGAPQHHHRVVKAHPLEDGRVPIRRRSTPSCTSTRVGKARALCARRQARPPAERGAQRRQRQFNGRPAGAVARHSAQNLWGHRLWKARIRVDRQASSETFSLPPNRPDARAYKDYRLAICSKPVRFPEGSIRASGRRQLLPPGRGHDAVG